jgi:hypothetical protein
MFQKAVVSATPIMAGGNPPEVQLTVACIPAVRSFVCISQLSSFAGLHSRNVFFWFSEAA